MEKKEYKKIDFTPRGFRDVYWCWHLNEPFVIEYRDSEVGRKRFCPNCNANDFDEENHIFICTVFKPFWHKTWDGIDETEKVVTPSLT